MIFGLPNRGNGPYYSLHEEQHAQGIAPLRVAPDIQARRNAIREYEARTARGQQMAASNPYKGSSIMFGIGNILAPAALGAYERKRLGDDLKPREQKDEYESVIGRIEAGEPMSDIARDLINSDERELRKLGLRYRMSESKRKPQRKPQQDTPYFDSLKKTEDPEEQGFLSRVGEVAGDVWDTINPIGSANAQQLEPNDSRSQDRSELERLSMEDLLDTVVPVARVPDVAPGEPGPSVTDDFVTTRQFVPTLRDLSAQYDMLNIIQSRFNEKYQDTWYRMGQARNELRAKHKNVPILGDVLGGPLTEEERRELYEYERFRAAGIALVNEYVNRITGAQINRWEAKRIMAAIPSTGDGTLPQQSDVSFVAKMDQALELTRLSVARTYYSMKNGFPVSLGTEDDPVYRINGVEMPITSFKSFIEQDLKRYASTLEGMDADEARRSIRQYTKENYGL